MAHDRHDDEFDGLTRREALLAAGAGGLSMMGFCSACEAGEVKMTSGASTPPKNISKAAPNNAVIQQMQTAAGLFKSGSFSGLRVSTENVVSKVQELFHKGEAAKKLGRDRSVVRVSAAAIEDSDKARALSHLSSQGFSASDLQGAQVFFTRSSLLDHTKVSGLKDLSADRVLQLAPLNNTNLNTITALSFDTKANILRINIALNADRGALQVALHNFAVPAKKPSDFPLRFIDPPVLKDPNIVGRIRVSSKVFKLLPPSSGSKSGDSSDSGSNESTATFDPYFCLSKCMETFLGEAVLEAVAWTCSACSFVIYGGGIATSASAGLLGPEVAEAIIIACGGCAVSAVVALLTCFTACTIAVLSN